MKPRMYHCLAALLVVLLPLTTRATIDSQLERYQSIFDKTLKKIETQHAANIRTLQRKYLSSLKALGMTQRDAGQDTSAVEKEIKRFRTEKTTAATDVVSDAADLAQLQTDYLQQTGALSLRKAGHIRTLATQYERSLDRIEKVVPRDDKASMLKVDAARTAMTENPAVAKAHGRVPGAAAQPSPTPGPNNATSTQPATDSDPQAPPEAPAPPPVPVERPKDPPLRRPRDTPQVALPSPTRTGEEDAYIADRFAWLCNLMLNRRWNDAATAVAYKGEAVDAGMLRGKLAKAFHFIGHAEDPSLQLSVGSVQIFDNTAIVTPQIWTGKAWRSVKQSHWVLIDDEWYMDAER